MVDEQLAADLNAAIRRLGRSHRSATGWALDQLGLAQGQELVLLTLADGRPRKMSELAGAAACEAPTMTSAVHRLEARGLVARAPSPTDRRAVLVSLTEEGRALVAPLQARLALVAGAAAGDLPAEEVRLVIDVLDRLVEGLEPPAGCCCPQA